MWLCVGRREGVAGKDQKSWNKEEEEEEVLSSLLEDIIIANDLQSFAKENG